MAKRIIFIASSKRQASYHMRADTISRALLSRGYDSRVVLWSGLPSLVHTIHEVRRADLVVLIKLLRPTMIPALAIAQCPVIYDCVDRFAFNRSFAYTVGRRWIDGFIANNHLHAEYVHAKIAKQRQFVRVIEHHHSNIERISKTVTGIKTVGYIGNPHDFRLSKSFFEWLRAEGFETYIKHDITLSNADAIVENLKLDAFLMMLPAHPKDKKERERLDNVVKFKPAQKILLPYSLGVPAIYWPYYSYGDAIRAAGYREDQFLHARTENELKDRLIELRSMFGTTKYDALIKMQKDVAEYFHLDRIVDKYEGLIHDLCT